MKTTEYLEQSGNQLNRRTDTPLSPGAHNSENDAARQSDSMAEYKNPLPTTATNAAQWLELGMPYC